MKMLNIIEKQNYSRLQDVTHKRVISYGIGIGNSKPCKTIVLTYLHCIYYLCCIYVLHPHLNYRIKQSKWVIDYSPPLVLSTIQH